MPRNYDTTNHLPFPRVQRVTIEYPPSQESSACYEESMAMVDANGHVQPLAGGVTTNNLAISSDLSQMVTLYDPTTGQPIPAGGAVPQQIPMQLIKLGIYSVIHADQLARDAAADGAGG